MGPAPPIFLFAGAPPPFLFFSRLPLALFLLMAPLRLLALTALFGFLPLALFLLMAPLRLLALTALFGFLPLALFLPLAPLRLLALTALLRFVAAVTLRILSRPPLAFFIFTRAPALLSLLTPSPGLFVITAPFGFIAIAALLVLFRLLPVCLFPLPVRCVLSLAALVGGAGYSNRRHARCAGQHICGRPLFSERRAAVLCNVGAMRCFARFFLTVGFPACAWPPRLRDRSAAPLKFAPASLVSFASPPMAVGLADPVFFSRKPLLCRAPVLRRRNMLQGNHRQQG
jgi:hypothetical protein